MVENLRISNRIRQIPKSAIHEMTRLSKQIEDVAFLSWTKPTSGAPVHIREVTTEVINKGLMDGYSESAGLLELRKENANKLNRDNHIDANPDQILVTVGAIEGIASAVLAVVDPGDEVILPSPTYSTHSNQVLLASGKPVFAPTIEDQGFMLDIEAVRKIITPKTKAILHCSPINPTGTVFSEQ